MKEYFLLFINANCSETHSNQLYLYIIHNYSQMRGKDFKKNASLKQTTHKRIVVVADGTVKNEKDIELGYVYKL